MTADTVTRKPCYCLTAPYLLDQVLFRDDQNCDMWRSFPFGPREPPKMVACGVMALHLTLGSAQGNMPDCGVVTALSKVIWLVMCLFLEQTTSGKAVSLDRFEDDL